MDKKEFLNRLTLLRYDSKIEAIHYKFYNRAVNTAISLAEQLEEIEKPIVPQGVADWYEYHKKDFEGSIYALCVQLYEDNLPESIKDWILCSDNKPIQTLVNMHQYGYTVEKKLYTAKLKSTGEYLRYRREFKEIHHFKTTDKDANSYEAYHFTKDELRKYNAWENEAYEVNEVEE